jgi:hypothetical protein
MWADGRLDLCRLCALTLCPVLRTLTSITSGLLANHSDTADNPLAESSVIVTLQITLLPRDLL